MKTKKKIEKTVVSLLQNEKIPDDNSLLDIFKFTSE